MASNVPQLPPVTAESSAYPSEQPFPGAVPAASSAFSQPRRTVMEIPPPLPRPTFIFRTDGGYSNDATWVFSAWTTRIEQYISASSTPTDVRNIHHSRCSMLSSACKQHDIVYIVMHHSYCTWSRNRQAAYHQMRPYAPGAIDSAFAALSGLLQSNDVLHTTQIEWFSHFPASTFDAYIPGPILASITKEIFEFLSTYAAKWHDFQARITARNFPVLIWEVTHTLRCSSVNMQDLIFSHSRRLLRCPDGAFSNAFVNLFYSDRRFEIAILSHPVSPDEIQRARNELVRRYIALVVQFRSPAHIPMSITSASPQALPARTPAAQQNIHTLSSQSSMINRTASHLPTTEGPVFEWSPQSQQSRILSMANTNVPSTIPSTHQSVPSTCGSASAIRNTVQDAGTSLPAASPPLIPPRNTSVSMAQHMQAAVAQNAIPSIPNFAATLHPAPGKVMRSIPESEYPCSAHHVSSLKVGLHLARQRSPCRVAHNVEAARYYQFVDNLIVQPTKLGVSTHLTEIKFSLSEDQLRSLPVRQAKFDLCALPVVRFGNNTRRFRVRVCRFASGEIEIGESKWAVASTFWPSQMQITINSKPCLLSRKQHFYADLPAEMLDAKAGYNELRVSLPALSGNESGHDYFIAVEQVITQNHASVWAGINSHPHASIETTKDTIKHHYGLGGTNEIALLGSTSNISVCDPISSRMCDTPVRGVNCKHLECFDLEIWLQSRPRKPGSSQTEPCLVDCWACPICDGDARPNQLRICEYFSDVVKQLRESNLQETRIVALSENGEWQPAVETSVHQKRESSSQPRGQPGQQHQASKCVEVIEILDD